MTQRDPSDEAAYDEAIAALTIGEPQATWQRIEIREYDPLWPALFEREEARIRAALGDRVLVLEHAGSTSVPGLPAKPLIDIVLEVPDSSDEASYVPDLEAAGYPLRIREPEWFEHRMFKGPDTNVNLHTFSEGCVESELMLLLPRLAARERRRPGALCDRQARAGGEGVEVRAAVRGREDRGRAGDSRPRAGSTRHAL